MLHHLRRKRKRKKSRHHRTSRTEISLKPEYTLIMFWISRPPPPVLEMPATFNLELMPGRTVALDTICAADDDLDMSRTDDGTLVGKSFRDLIVDLSTHEPT